VLREGEHDGMDSVDALAAIAAIRSPGSTPALVWTTDVSATPLP
jgi:hypothetical protein